MVKLENLERSSRIFQVTLPLAECLARRFFLRDGIFSSFLFFFSFFFFPPFPFVSFRYAYTNNICQSHLYLGRIEVQNETKKLRMISSNT